MQPLHSCSLAAASLILQIDWPHWR